MSLEVDEVLDHHRSKYQDVLVFKSKKHGNVLVLDGVIQVCDVLNGCSGNTIISCHTRIYYGFVLTENGFSPSVTYLNFSLYPRSLNEMNSPIRK